MPEHDQTNPHNLRRRPASHPLRPVLIVIIILLLLVLGSVALFFFPSSKQAPDAVPGADNTVPLSVREPAVAPTPTTPGIPAEVIISDRQEESQQDDMPVPATEVEEFEPGMIPPPDPERISLLCSRTAIRLHDFFKHVDRQDYIGRFHLDEPSLNYFTTLANRLLENPPVVSRESDDLYTILRNMAHFFRIIGKNNIILLKTILDRERDKIEDVAAQLYYWTTIGNCRDEQFSFSPALEKMYEYAGFFLNTMGGRSYLFRRDSRSRLLVNYYSIMLIDRANAMGINRYGIDISLIIPQLMREIESSNQLIYKENYLDRLAELLERYPAPDPAE